MVKILATLAVLFVATAPAFAQPLWCWSFAGNGISATGTITTGTDTDGDGFYSIVSIAGTANAATITALQPAGTAVPGNAGFPVDNLIRLAAPQLSKHGFGFATADGVYHNPFYLEQYHDYIALPPYATGKGTEPTIQFKVIAAAADAGCKTK